MCLCVTWTGNSLLKPATDQHPNMFGYVDWDLGMCLPKECKWKALTAPPAMSHWMDLKASVIQWPPACSAQCDGLMQGVSCLLSTTSGGA